MKLYARINILNGKSQYPKTTVLETIFFWRKDVASDYLNIVLRSRMRFIFDRKEKNSSSVIVIKTRHDEF